MRYLTLETLDVNTFPSRDEIITPTKGDQNDAREMLPLGTYYYINQKNHDSTEP